MEAYRREFGASTTVPTWWFSSTCGERLMAVKELARRTALAQTDRRVTVASGGNRGAERDQAR